MLRNAMQSAFDAINTTISSETVVKKSRRCCKKEVENGTIVSQAVKDEERNTILGKMEATSIPKYSKVGDRRGSKSH